MSRESDRVYPGSEERVESGHLFVYGTLREDTGHPASRLLRRGARVLGSAVMTGCLYDLGSHPGAVRSPDPEHRIHGLCYRIEPGREELLLAELDRYEGPDFRRETVSVTLANAESVAAWVYLYVRPPPAERRIESGDWKKSILRESAARSRRSVPER